MQTKTDQDLFTLEIVKEAFVASAEEMFTVGARTSKSVVIYELLDYSCAVTDVGGELVSQALGVPLFLGTMPFGVKFIRERFPDGQLEEGDVLITNDPYRAGTHSSDVTMAMPVFHEGQLIAFCVNMAHWTEIGGKEPGSWSTSATDVLHEGLIMPPVKILNRGELVEPVTELILANSRAPDEVRGTLMSQLASVRVGARRIQELCRRYSGEVVLAAMEYMMALSEQRTLDALRAVPNGTYFATDIIDDDGVSDESYEVCVRVDVGDDYLHVDLTGSAPEVVGPINCSYPTLISGLQIMFLAITDPHVQVNAGAFRPLRVTCPSGTVFTAQRPRPTGVYFEAMNYAADLVWQALATSLPRRLSAGHFMTPYSHLIVGKHPDTGADGYLVAVMCGGWGAGDDQDGASSTVALATGETNMVSVEITEATYGLLVERFSLDDEAEGGEGRYRGGKGVVREYRILADDGATATVTNGRVKSAPWGVSGGMDGARNFVEVVRADGTVTRHGKLSACPLAKGDSLRLVSGGGGGWGSPQDRDSAAVRRDVLNGIVTARAATETYGVAPANGRAGQ